MDEDFLAVTAGVNTYRLHQCVTGRFAVARHLAIDMFGVQTVWAVVALTSARDRGADELLAMTTLERLIRFRSW